MNTLGSIGIDTEAYTQVENRYVCLSINKNAIPTSFLPSKKHTHLLYKNRLFPIYEESDHFDLCCGYIRSVDELIKALESNIANYCISQRSGLLDCLSNTGDSIISLENSKEYVIIETYRTYRVLHHGADVNFYCIGDDKNQYWISEDDLINKLKNSVVSIKQDPIPYHNKKEYGIAGTLVQVLFYKEQSTGLLGAKLRYKNNYYDLIYNVSGDSFNYGSNQLPEFHGYVPDIFAKWINDNNIGEILNGNNGAMYDIKGYKLIHFKIDEDNILKQREFFNSGQEHSLFTIPTKYLQKKEYTQVLKIIAKPIKRNEPIIMSEDEIIYHLGHGDGDVLGF